MNAVEFARCGSESLMSKIRNYFNWSEMRLLLKLSRRNYYRILSLEPLIFRMCPDNLYLWEHNQEFDSKICHKTCHKRKMLRYIIYLRYIFPHFQIKRDKVPSIKSFIVKCFYDIKFIETNFN